MSNRLKSKKRFLLYQSSLLIFISALVAGVSTLFLSTLNYFFHLFTENLWLVFVLPFFGVFTLWIYQKLSSSASTSHLSFEGLLLYQSESAQNLGWGSSLLVFSFASLSQLFGASTGREGGALQYGASLGSATAHLQHRLTGEKDFDLFVKAGLVAGFSSLFGTPVAALVFLGERFGFRQPQAQALRWALVAYLSFYFSNIFQSAHTDYPDWPTFSWNLTVLFSFILLFIFIVVLAFIYKKLLGLFFKGEFLLFKNPYYRILLGGFVVAGLTWAVGSARYNGLGISLIDEAFKQSAAAYDPLMKALFTLISLTSGFKGGEVTPLISIGALIGSSLFPWLGLPLVACAAVGAMFFFAQVLGIPLTGAVLLIELFGGASAPVALCGGFILWGLQHSRFKYLKL